MPIKSDKRPRLIKAAKRLIHQQGFHLTTLSDIGIEANVPLGNIYYYFKTKNDIGIAVIELITLEQKTFFQHLNQESSPETRLRYFLEHVKQEAKVIALQGCQTGTLCQELGKNGGILANLAAKVLMDFLFWAEIQFFELGFIQEASDLSLDLTYKLQGIFLLGLAFKNPTVITQQITLLQEQLKELITERIPEPEEMPA